jgi:hypothetical protein
VKVCAERGCPELVDRGSRCPEHRGEQRRKQDADRPSSAARGYGVKHQRQRKDWAALVESGAVSCRRCGRPIPPGSPWDLGHDDVDRSLPAAPEHAACNRATRGRGTTTSPIGVRPLGSVKRPEPGSGGRGRDGRYRR